MPATFTWIPFYGTSADFAPNIRRVNLGGYEFRGREGINTFPLKYNLIFSKARQSEIGEVLVFLQAREAIDAFYWTPPYPYDTTGPYTASDARPAYLFTCPNWKQIIEESNADSVTLSFVQDFNPPVSIAPPVFTNDYTGLPLLSGIFAPDALISVRAHAGLGKRVRFVVDTSPVTDSSPFWPGYPPNDSSPGLGTDNFLGFIQDGLPHTIRAVACDGNDWTNISDVAVLSLSYSP